MRTALLLASLVTLQSLATGPAPDALDSCTTAPAGGRVFLIDGSHPQARDDGQGNAAQPWKTLAAASRRDLRPGDTIRIRGGQYRGALRPRSPGLTIEGCLGEEVIISGAIELNTDWTAAGKAWQAERYRPRHGFGDTYDENFVVAGGALLTPAENRESMSPQSFIVEEDRYGSPRLLLGLTEHPDSAGIQVAVHEVLFGPSDGTPCRDTNPAEPGHKVRNLTFRHAANPAQTGAVCVWGEGALLEDVQVQDTNGRGVEVWGARHTVRRVETSGHGHLGIGGGCVDCLIEDVTADRNNWREHDPFWEAGGGKWVFTERTVFRRFVARDNDGPGLWLDGDSSDNLIQGAVLSGNLVSGLQLELGSDRNRVEDSFISGTRRDGWAAAGILIMAAEGTVLVGNEVFGNEGSGLWVRVDSRQPTGGVSAENNWFHGNAVSPGDKNFQVRVDLDIAPGGSFPPLSWTGNRLSAEPVGHVAGARMDRESPVLEFESDEDFARALRLR